MQKCGRLIEAKKLRGNTETHANIFTAGLLV